MTGASGLVGRALAKALPEIVPLPRRPPPEGGLWWDPEAGVVHDDGRDIRAVVHLAGEGVASGRWTRGRKLRIQNSRLRGTRTLARWFADRDPKPDAMVSASAIGYYGDRGDQILEESSGSGAGFLPTVCRGWEAEAKAAERAGVRVARLRLGLVLDPAGGVLKRLAPLFRAGLGGPVGSGQQWFPWVHMDDVVGAIRWALDEPDALGPYNTVAPGIVRQGEFADALAAAYGRRARLPAPGWALRLAFGSMADEALLASQRVVPSRLREQGFRFRWPELRAALAQLLGGNAPQ